MRRAEGRAGPAGLSGTHSQMAFFKRRFPLLVAEIPLLSLQTGAVLPGVCQKVAIGSLQGGREKQVAQGGLGMIF